MKITIRKTADIIIDTDRERKRINKAFRGKQYKETRQKLHKLMDLVDECKWDKASKELNNKWWRGYDDHVHCPRLEFVGLIVDKEGNRFFNFLTSYADLVFNMVNYPKNYTVIATNKSISLRA